MEDEAGWQWRSARLIGSGLHCPSDGSATVVVVVVVVVVVAV